MTIKDEVMAVVPSVAERLMVEVKMKLRESCNPEVFASLWPDQYEDCSKLLISLAENYAHRDDVVLSIEEAAVPDGRTIRVKINVDTDCNSDIEVTLRPATLYVLQNGR